MSITIRPANLTAVPTFRAQGEAAASKVVSNPVTMDDLPNKSEKPAKKGFFEYVGDIFGMPKKAVVAAMKTWVYASEGIKGLFLGTVKGLAYGTGIFALGWLINEIKKPKTERKVIIGMADGIAKAGNVLAGIVSKLPDAKVILLPIYPFKGVWKAAKALINAEGVGRLGKVIVAVVAIGTFALAMIRAKLNINQRTADIDHRWNTGHRAEK